MEKTLRQYLADRDRETYENYNRPMMEFWPGDEWAAWVSSHRRNPGVEEYFCASDMKSSPLCPYGVH